MLDAFLIIRSFNPRTHVGCDFIFGHEMTHQIKFQSTHPRRVRLEQDCSREQARRFQSTHPRRVRQPYPSFITFSIWFQSTHPRRARQPYPSFITFSIWFQSTHPRRVRLVGTSLALISDSFNPRTHVGCDILVILIWFGAKFQSTHPRRVRPIVVLPLPSTE